MKSLIIALSLLLAYSPIVSAEEAGGDDFGIESAPEALINDWSDMSEDAARSAQDEIGEIVILEGAGNVAIAKYVPNPRANVEEDNDDADKDVVDDVESLPDGQAETLQEAAPDITPEVPVEVQTETDTIVPAEDVQNSDTSDDGADVVIIEETESAEETSQPEAVKEESAPQEDVTVEEVVIETDTEAATESETEVSESKEDTNTQQKENIESAEVKDIPVVTEEVVVTETPAVDEEESEDDGKTKEEYDEEISYYIKNMNLSVEQLDMAKYISSDSRLKMDQLLKSIYLLRAQARELEAKSLNDFEAILTEEQKEQFHKLRATQEKSRKKFEIFDVKAMEEEDASQADDASGDAENKPTE